MDRGGKKVTGDILYHAFVYNHNHKLVYDEFICKRMYVRQWNERGKDKCEIGCKGLMGRRVQEFVVGF